MGSSSRDRCSTVQHCAAQRRGVRLCLAIPAACANTKPHASRLVHATRRAEERAWKHAQWHWGGAVERAGGARRGGRAMRWLSIVPRVGGEGQPADQGQGQCCCPVQCSAWPCRASRPSDRKASFPVDRPYTSQTQPRASTRPHPRFLSLSLSLCLSARVCVCACFPRHPEGRACVVRGAAGCWCHERRAHRCRATTALAEHRAAEKEGWGESGREKKKQETGRGVQSRLCVQGGLQAGRLAGRAEEGQGWWAKRT